MSGPLIADTGGLLRAVAATPDGGESHPEFAEALRSARLVIVPGLVLSEIDYFLRDHRAAMRQLVKEIFDPATRYDFEPPAPGDIARAMELDGQFPQLQLGLVDCTIAALAERRGVYRVLTTDRRHFAAIRVGARLTRPLELVP